MAFLLYEFLLSGVLAACLSAAKGSTWGPNQMSRRQRRAPPIWAGAGASKDQLEAIVADESLALIDHYQIVRGALYKGLSAASEVGDGNAVGLLAGRLHENLIWLLLARRGSGKTRTLAEWVCHQAASGQASRIALIAVTAADARCPG